MESVGELIRKMANLIGLSRQNKALIDGQPIGGPALLDIGTKRRFVGSASAGWRKM
jgi:hypothetical protein